MVQLLSHSWSLGCLNGSFTIFDWFLPWNIFIYCIFSSSLSLPHANIDNDHQVVAALLTHVGAGSEEEADCALETLSSLAHTPDKRLDRRSFFEVFENRDILVRIFGWLTLLEEVNIPNKKKSKFYPPLLRCSPPHPTPPHPIPRQEAATLINFFLYIYFFNRK